MVKIKMNDHWYSRHPFEDYKFRAVLIFVKTVKKAQTTYTIPIYTTNPLKVVVMQDMAQRTLKNVKLVGIGGFYTREDDDADSEIIDLIQ